MPKTSETKVSASEAMANTMGFGFDVHLFLICPPHRSGMSAAPPSTPIRSCSTAAAPVGEIALQNQGRRHSVHHFFPLFGVFAAVENPESACAQIALLAREHGAEELVLGLPLNMDGSRGPRAEKAEAMAELLRQETGLPVALW